MIIYLSMILWVMFMRVLCVQGITHGMLDNGARYYKVGKWAAFLTMGYIVFWVGMRTGYVDTSAYIAGFRQASPELSQIPELLAWDSKVKGQGWQAMLIIFKALVSENYHAWLMFHAVVMGFAVAACYKSYSEAFFFCMLLFILNGNFTWMMNGLRQFFCVSMLMLATPWLLKGKTVHYMLLIAALSLIHFSVWIMVPIYFVVRQKPWGKLTLLAIMATVAACALAAPLADTVEESLQSTSYAGSTVFLDDDDGAHPLWIVLSAIPAVMGFVMRKRLQSENNAMINIGINLSIIASLLFTFAYFTSGILMGRLPIYCDVYAPITLSLLFARCNSSIMRKVLPLGCIACYALFFYLLYYNNIHYVSDLTGFLSPRL